MAEVFVTRALPGRALEILLAVGHNVRVWPEDRAITTSALAAELPGADAAITMFMDRVTPSLLDSAPSLQVIANMAVGFDNIDVAHAAARGIWVTNTPGVLVDTTADLTWALILAAARNIALADRLTRTTGWPEWSPGAFAGMDLAGATLGIVGLGAVGEAVARRAAGFRMRILYTSRTRKPAVEEQLGARHTTLPALLAESDVVSLHVALAPETRHLIGAPEFALMKPSALLVNAARGPVVDTTALLDALREGAISGAALDVTDPEPLPEDHPLFEFPNVVITPHIGSATVATRARMAEMAAVNVVEVLAGRPPVNPVNRPAPR